MRRHQKTISWFFLYLFVFQIGIESVYALKNHDIISYRFWNSKENINISASFLTPQVSPLTSTPVKAELYEVKEGTNTVACSNNTEYTNLKSGTRQSRLNEVNQGTSNHFIIGYHPATGVDEPFDNVFVFDWETKDVDKQVFLTADVKGVSNASGLSFSVNQQQVVGGYFVEKSNDWKRIKIPLSTTHLHNGKNHILFTNGDNQQLFYELKNLQIQIENTNKNTDFQLFDEQVLFTHNQKAYLKGTVQPNVKNIRINGVKAQLQGDFFEVVFPMESNCNSVTIELDKSNTTESLQHTFSEQKELTFAQKMEEFSLSTAVQFDANSSTWQVSLPSLFLEIPSESYPKASQITATPLRPRDVAPLGQKIVNVTATNSGYRLLPAGAKFSESLSLSLGIDDQKLPKGYHLHDVQIFYFDVDEKRWVAIETKSIDTENNTITGLTNHFTDFIAGVIQAPEHPEGEAFAPTTISDMQVAQPLANQMQIAPPTANQLGDGRIEFPIHIPSGRNGLQPNLSLSYNHSGSSSVVGYGWDLPIPSIAINSKFGVPEFHAQKETESYLFNGEELLQKNGSNLYLAHREEHHINRTSPAFFYPKVEGDFSRIERLGTAPNAYSWVVWDKLGTKYYYGTHLNSRMYDSATGNISQWFLDKIEDKNGNYISYNYHTKHYESDHLEGGKEVLLGSIGYTFHLNLPYGNFNRHQINFIYSDASRPDATISYRNGFKEVSASVLEKIEVSSYDTGRKKSEYGINYLLNHSTGVFSKHLLQSIETQYVKYNAQGGIESSHSYHHAFDYYNDVSGGLFGEERILNTPSDIGLGIIDDLDFLNKVDLSMLHASVDKGVEQKHIEGGVGVGLGTLASNNPITYIGTISTAFAFPVRVTNKPIVQLVDIDADGLPDKVVKIGNQWKYRKNLDGLAFSPQLYSIHNFNELNVTASKTVNKPDINLNLFHTTIGFSKNNTLSNTTTYLSDVNADGILDYVRDKKVFFGKIDSTLGQPTFTVNSAETPNVIYKGSEVEESVLNQPVEFSNANDLMEIVKVWRAPKSGKININGTVSKDFTSVDQGVRVAIQRSYWQTFSNGNFLLNDEEENDESLIENDEFVEELVENSVENDDFVEELVENLVENDEFVEELVENSVESDDFVEELVENSVESGDFVQELVENSVESGDFVQELVENSVENDDFVEELVENSVESDDFVEELVENHFSPIGIGRFYTNSYILSPSLMVAQSMPTNFQNISVTKGDLIFFRVNSSQIPVDELSITWNPEIVYTNENFESPNSYKQYSSNYSDAFVYGTSQPKIEVIKEPGVYQLGWNAFPINNVTFQGAELSDEVRIRFSVYKTAQNGVQLVEQKETIIPINGNHLVQAPHFQLNLSQIDKYNPDTYRFVKVEVLANSQINWKKLDTKFNPFFQKIGGEKVDLIPYYQVFANQHTQYAPSVLVGSPKKVVVKHNFSLSNCTSVDCENQYVYFVVKNQRGQIPNNLIVNGQNFPAKIRYKLNAQGQVTERKAYSHSTKDYTVSIPTTQSILSFSIPHSAVIQRKTHFFEYYTSSKKVAHKLASYQNFNSLVFNENGSSAQNNYVAGFQGLYKANIFSSENNLQVGTLYRNWGQFAYKGANPGEPFQYINRNHLSISPLVGDSEGYSQSSIQQLENLMNTPDSEADSIDENDNGTIAIGTNTVLNTNRLQALERFAALTPHRANASWQMHNKLKVTATQSSPFLRYEDQDASYNPSVSTTVSPCASCEAVGIVKQSETHSKSRTRSSSIVFTSISMATNSGESRMLNDFTDINGDGYPDVLGGAIQLTNSRGGLTNTLQAKSLQMNQQTNGSGATAGGSAQVFSTSIKGQKSNTHTVKNHHNINGAGSLSDSYFESTTENQGIFIDLNGDGLADEVDFDNKKVFFNLGKSFHTENYTGFAVQNKHLVSTSRNFGISPSAGLGYAFTPNVNDRFNADFHLGVTGSETISEQKTQFYDINGDGLVDFVSNKQVFINTGTGFVTSGMQLPDFEKNTTVQIGWMTNLSVLFPVSVFGITIKFGGGGGYSRSSSFHSEKIRLMDFDGDGFVDVLYSDKEERLKVRLSNIRRTNLLKKVSNPTGSSFIMDYATTGSTYKMPFKKWVLSSVDIHDGFVGDGADVQRQRFEYQNGFKDRRERKFLGFGEIKTHQLDDNEQVYRTQTQEFVLNQLTDTEATEPSMSGKVRKYQYIGQLPWKSSLKDASGRVLNEQITDYRLVSLTANQPMGNFNTTEASTQNFGDKSRILPLVKTLTQKTHHFEGMSNDFITHTQSTQFQRYDRYSQPLQVKLVEDNLDVRILYHTINNSSKYLVSIPRQHRILHNNQVLRKSDTTIDAVGNIRSISRDRLDGQQAITNYEYNTFGLLTKVTLPKQTANSPESSRMSYSYIYDPKYYQFVTQVTDAHGYISSKSYSNFGKIESVTDTNGNQFFYDYDAMQRLVLFKGPYHNEKTIEHEYGRTVQNIPYAVTKHYITDNQHAQNAPQQIVHTVSFSDGLGRIIQTKKQLDTPQECVGGNGYWLEVSGKQLYDALGRVTASYLSKEEKNCQGDFNTQLRLYSDLTHNNQEKTTVAYDALDRPLLQTVVGLDAVTSYIYGKDNATQTATTQVILPEGNQTTTYTDRRGHTVQSVQYNSDTNEALATQFAYNALGELLQVTDAEGHHTKYQYNKLGQKTQTIHPDSGTTKFEYNLDGSLRRMANEKLNHNNQWINYSYNKNQLIQVQYPSHTVSYEYGTASDLGNGQNRVGRLKKVTDLTGTREFSYGKLGEITQDYRVLQSQNGVMQFYTTTQTDSWGRVLEMTYPDGEKLFYEYNTIGQLKKIKNSNNYVYLRHVLYTFFGEAKEIEYGNKVKTQNDFDTMRRLRTMRLRRPSNHIFSNVQYDYDRNQNIVRQRNTVSQHNNLHLGGVSDKQYQYDKYNRLSRAIGTFTGFKEEQNYDLTMSYNATHSIVNKNQTHNVTLNQVPQNSVHNYQAEYFYDDDTHPHAPSLLQYQDGKSIKLSYDANGNLEHIQSDKDLVVVGNRDFEWDEQNRLLSVVDNGGQQISHYVYDHTGERTFKSEQGLSLANVSGQQAYEVSDMTNYTLYPSGFVTVNPERNEYTKHYYNNGKRLASRLMTLQGQFVSQNQLQPQAMSMQAMSATQSPQNCQQQLDAIMQYLANDPAMTDCLTAVQNINADPSYQNACDKLYAVNALNCSPADVIDVVITDPVYTPEEISELDCINAIYQLFYLSVYKSSSTYWLNADVKRCYSQIKGIIMKYFITPEPQRMDPCEFWEYLQQFLPCEPTPTIQEPVPTPTEPITYEPPVMTQPTPIVGFEPVEQSIDKVYYYHGDHLNSSTYVTDNNGRPVAYYDYLPFGEVAVEHNQTTNFNNGYKFNGKELDEATGMSYYGARYYDSRLSVFVSVDPLAEEFVGWTPYHYVHQNPINLIDPTGMSAENGDGKGNGWLSKIWNRVKNTFNPNSKIEDITILDEIIININKISEEERIKEKQIDKIKEEWKSEEVKNEWRRLGVWDDNVSYNNYFEALGNQLSLIMPNAGANVYLAVIKNVRNFKYFDNLDDLKPLFKNKSLDDLSTILQKNGWNKLEGNWKTRTVFEKRIGKKKFYAQWEVNNVHSKNNKPVGYWKVTYGKINATKRNTFRVSPDYNFKP
ncbi:SpvB/TcaC N-terminal domain-containing protein [Capnocytophaga sp. ARDL2]|uniref:SpvB/TcaC N-terminal domain-containing protein n=1 Tax=Capnocytophaga sp. ARDL2 TaxID=3238809 RepID=UPI003557D718